MSSWDPSQYLRFKDERTIPSHDLAEKLTLRAPEEIFDVGCGPGNSTAVLRERYKTAHITGGDLSPDMISRARKDHPDMDFIVFDAKTGFDGIHDRYDIIFANASLQWVEGHRELVPKMYRALKKDGELAVQIPRQDIHPMHRILREIASRERWIDHSDIRPRKMNILSPEGYYDLLSGLGSEFRIWETVYYHVMGSHEAIIDWYKGAGMRPYFEALDEKMRPGFTAEVLEEVRKEYKKQDDGRILLKFPRLFFIVKKK